MVVKSSSALTVKWCMFTRFCCGRFQTQSSFVLGGLKGIRLLKSVYTSLIAANLKFCRRLLFWKQRRRCSGFAPAPVCELDALCFRVGASPDSLTQTCQTALISWVVSEAPGLFSRHCVRLNFCCWGRRCRVWGGRWVWRFNQDQLLERDRPVLTSLDLE